MIKSTTPRDLDIEQPGRPEPHVEAHERKKKPKDEAATIAAMSPDEQAAEILRLRAEVESLKPKGRVPVKLPTLAEAKAMEQEALDAGQVPIAVETTEGHYVPRLAHASVEDVEKHLNARAMRMQGEAARNRAA